ncbi:hypothetical protein OEZ86_005497 [Tetradesmus obliquus]|nr:hypothetical protein OEZ86_005497 [Tetradesmus obliquus]
MGQQCGDQAGRWAGKACDAGACVRVNDWFMQCIPTDNSASVTLVPPNVLQAWEACNAADNPKAVCPQGYTCVRMDEWYSQCRPSQTEVTAGSAPATLQEASAQSGLPAIQAAQLSLWSQCGGFGSCGGHFPCSDTAWTMASCPTGSSCMRSDKWFWQCRPDQTAAATAAAAIGSTRILHSSPGAVSRLGLWQQCGGKGTCGGNSPCADQAWATVACSPGSSSEGTKGKTPAGNASQAAGTAAAAAPTAELTFPGMSPDQFQGDSPAAAATREAVSKVTGVPADQIKAFFAAAPGRRRLLQQAGTTATITLPNQEAADRLKAAANMDSPNASGSGSSSSSSVYADETHSGADKKQKLDAYKQREHSREAPGAAAAGVDEASGAEVQPGYWRGSYGVYKDEKQEIQPAAVSDVDTGRDQQGARHYNKEYDVAASEELVLRSSGEGVAPAAAAAAAAAAGAGGGGWGTWFSSWWADKADDEDLPASRVVQDSELGQGQQASPQEPWMDIGQLRSTYSRPTTPEVSRPTSPVGTGPSSPVGSGTAAAAAAAAAAGAKAPIALGRVESYPISIEPSSPTNTVTSTISSGGWQPQPAYAGPATSSDPARMARRRLMR